MFSLCVTLMFSVRSEIVITGVGMNSLCNFTKYYSCEISLNVNFKCAVCVHHKFYDAARQCLTKFGNLSFYLPKCQNSHLHLGHIF